MSEWLSTNIGAICQRVVSGGTPLTSNHDYYQNGQIPWLKTKEVNQSRIYSTENHITQLGLDNSSAKLIPVNSVVIAMYGDGQTAGRVALTKIPLATNQACCNLIVDENKSHAEFIFYYLLGSYDELVARKTGSGQQNLNAQLIKSFEIPFPPLQEQKAIASVLSSLDDKIDLLHRQNTTLERMAETLFRQWFVEEAQEDWEEVAITKLFDVRDGTHDSPKQKTIGKPLITSKHINGNRLDFESAYLISDEDFDKINQRSKVDKNDILISMIGTIGLIYLEQSDEVNYAIKNVGLLKTSQNPDWMAYTYFWLKSHLGRQFLDEHISGSTQEYVSLGSFRSIAFKKPPIEKLEEFNKIANGYLHKIKNNSAQIKTLEKLRDNLLPKLMSGEVKVA